jgi:hypothetical protein
MLTVYLLSPASPDVARLFPYLLSIAGAVERFCHCFSGDYSLGSKVARRLTLFLRRTHWAFIDLSDLLGYPLR